MDTINTAPSAFNLREPIPGYLLRKRIGSGGYGEVWLADAPGGLTKAVKIVYGPLQDGRAERELKALNRIKQVQHPLLLTLERIEMVDEHLIIVMELAHGSLKDRFEKHVAEGGRGIPRGELLAYLRDVADALDYLYVEHSLQHLDVKPENLLLIANRVKVADFGLIKDLGDRSASLVGGLTPLYAPPEVFDGRPNRNSDQYSLAMVYQELMTGEPAFAGRTAAQLAAQHLHSSPCLAPLPLSDQQVIARALSKDPDRRFPSCRALIDSLTEAPKATSRVRRSVPETTRITPLADSPICSSNTSSELRPAVSYPVANAARVLPGFDLNQEAEVTCRPAIFIGVGGTGASVLRSLRGRLYERFGNVDDIPSLQMLLLDTDAAALHNAARGDRASALRSNQLVTLTLRQPQEYRSDATTLLEWLNRRWLFNIPRSLTTEGIRPLGRLALVDHFEKIANVLHHALSSAIEDESLAASSRVTGLRFVKESPRLYVVASMAGGVGSGLVLDLGYLLRTMLEELHISDEQLHGVLVHSTSRRTNQRDLAIANSLSLLSELHHYTSDSGYPGEPACKLPPRVGNSTPFRHTYVTHLGDELSDEEFAKGTADLSEYLYQNTVTASSSFFDRCRNAANDTPDAARTNVAAVQAVRSFGLVQVGGTNVEFVRQEADLLCETLVGRWATRPQAANASCESTSIDSAIAKLAHHSADVMDLRTDKLVAWAQSLVERELGSAPEAFCQRRIAEIVEQSGGGDTRERVRLATTAIRNEWCGAHEGDDSLRTRVSKHAATVAVARRETLRKWLFALVDSPAARVHGAQDAVRWYQELLQDNELQIERTLTQLDEATDRPSGPAVPDAAFRDLMTELQRMTLGAAVLLVRELKIELSQCEDQLREFARRVLHLANEFTSPSRSKLDADNGLARLLKENHLELSKQLDRELTPVLVRKSLTFSHLLTADSDLWNQLVSTMRAMAQRLASNVISRLQVSSVLQGEGNRFAAGPVDPAAAVREAMPRLRDCGGESRVLLVAPSAANKWPADWRQPFDLAADGSVSLVAGTDDALVVCCETQHVPLRNVAAHLVGTRSDVVKVASRLHTRIDVEWQSIERWLHNKA